MCICKSNETSKRWKERPLETFGGRQMKCEQREAVSAVPLRLYVEWSIDEPVTTAACREPDHHDWRAACEPMQIRRWRGEDDLRILKSEAEM